MQAQELLREMQKLDKSGLIQLLGISDKLADQNLAWLKTYPEQPEKPCVLAFDGPAYRALDARSFTPQQQAAAQVIRMRRKKPAVPSGQLRRPCNRLDLRRGDAVRRPPREYHARRRAKAELKPSKRPLRYASRAAGAPPHPLRAARAAAPLRRRAALPPRDVLPAPHAARRQPL